MGGLPWVIHLDPKSSQESSNVEEGGKRRVRGRDVATPAGSDACELRNQSTGTGLEEEGRRTRAMDWGNL